MALETSLAEPAPVRQIANAIAGWVDRLGAVWVEGQVAQVSRRPGLGTVFMTLRDAVADISVPVTCSRVLFDSLNPPLVEGASVVIHAKPSYYANRGTLSLAAREIRMVGLGELLARLERRRQLLAAEGLFERHLKRPLPFLPTRVGLVTAPNSAAERDVLENARRRWPAVRFEVAYAAMQGTRSCAEVMEAIDRLDRHPEVDVIVVARGGGSVEDLLPFSDEALVRAVAATRTPVVSAIGHEPDQPLLDLVADVRASTPTDAAKLVVPDVVDELRGVEAARERLRSVLAGWLAREQAGLDALRSRPALADPRSLVEARVTEIEQLRDRARRTLGHRLDRAADDIDHQRARARALSPLATLERGYAVLQDADGHVVTSVAGVAAGAAVSVRVADGRVHATTTGVEADPLETTGGTDG
ncbi:exodeoxyribonuclease VII large subunit [Nocardioides marmotae]|uniref:Exodeoxyribonuclease 7 large subunit n=1 Tax=Nocardioides marmotae TaxID=2663857 RepID=A0A6I3J512_9ACTN|nr:exodeoxyribonuclease VII large subunit [Nocardioides marmotae]MCR6030558.1 exodeoxyribonuclease VII large subunit [Gordonia jinghuaiqii]MBC9734942.1 exodeoxyribonuclease VII large subunit [Nocardioides marmotae]MTB86041.1 exodeoxyribonuclease VII large subunit [Nocardioides marmotae]MTB94194.1 exodeoxyribonuclease VII large subunit [Nocardioides marmotae]QKE00482.1 exodeoxyribonuclease VII large subunit [Nocardioides marmotae]